MHHSEPLILLTGATGYVGGRLLKALEAAGRRVRCLARRPEFLTPRVAQGTEVAAGDALDRVTLGPALAGAPGPGVAGCGRCPGLLAGGGL